LRRIADLTFTKADVDKSGGIDINEFVTVYSDLMKEKEKLLESDFL
jgi:hypothetical protein